MIVLIPSLDPTDALGILVESLSRELPEARILIIDDGSGSAFRSVFTDLEQANVTVIGYEENRGKGYALRTGFRWCLENAPGEVVVCADSDGQHHAADIAKVAEAARTHPGAVILGARAFHGTVPLRSRVGNSVSSRFFRLASGVKIRDTQTGLRAYDSRDLRDLLDVPGDRFEWELNALLAAADRKQEIIEIPIDTIYEDGNRGSHFRPLTDSIRVLWPLVSFAAVGIGSWALEMLVFMAFSAALTFAGVWGLTFAVVTSRLVSGTVNFLANKYAVFGDSAKNQTRRQALQYVFLALVLLSVTVVGVDTLAWIGLAPWIAKLILDVSCFGISFIVQRRWIFRPSQRMQDNAHEPVRTL